MDYNLDAIKFLHEKKDKLLMSRIK